MSAGVDGEVWWVVVVVGLSVPDSLSETVFGRGRSFRAEWIVARGVVGGVLLEVKKRGVGVLGGSW